tara:strand:- start:198 stop:464 length:267 start_codon:yes stop_codon:yes gene_type:complete
MAFKMRGFPMQQTSSLKQVDEDKKKDRQAKRASKKEERITDPDGRVLTTIERLEGQYTRAQIKANKDGVQDRLRNLYEKLYPGEEYTP